MTLEIERKFLVCSDEWREGVIRTEWCRQAFLARTPQSSVRVRRWATRGEITVKSIRVGFVRQEFEYLIAADEAEYMLQRLCITPILEKDRHWVEYGGMIWQVDVYRGAALGLVLAEVELARPDQPFALPRWVSAEVTDDLRYHSAGVASGAWRKAAAARAPDRVRASRAAPTPQLHG
jgi:adenylate cyclase